MPKDNRFPDLGLFFGDQGGPGTGLPQTDNARNCPFLDEQMGEFCSLDGAMCPFVGFNYRKCKKYTNNIARGALSTQGIISQVLPRKNGPPRVENALTEGKKRGPSLPLYESEETKVAGAAISSTLQNLLRAGLVSTAGQINGAGKEMAAGAATEMMDNGLVPDGPVAQPPGPDDTFVRPRVPTAEAEKYKKKMRAVRADFENYNRGVLKLKFIGASPQQYKNATAALFKIIHEVAFSRYRDPEAHANAQVMLVQRSRNNARQTPGRRAKDGTVIPPVELSTADEIMTKFFSMFAPEGEIEGNQTPTAAANEPPNTDPLDTDAGFDMNWDPLEPEAVVTKKDMAKAQAAEKKAAKAQAAAEKKKAAAEKKAANKPTMLGGKYKMRRKPKLRLKRQKGYTQKRHKSGFAQTGKARTGVQFETWLMGLSEHSRDLMFQGEERYGAAQDAVDLAHDLYAQNNTSDIEGMRSYLEGRLKAQETFFTKQQQFNRDFEENKRRLSQLPGFDMAAMEKKAHDPEQLGKMASIANKFQNKLFNIEAKNLKIGSSTVTRFLKTSAVPKLTRADYETMRMSEQAGLHAIQLQHQYGRKFAQWNTFIMSLEDFFLPLAVMSMTSLGDARASVLMALKSWFPRRVLLSFFTAFLQNPLPKHDGSTSLKPSVSTKFWGSQKMQQPGRSKTILKGYDTDPAGIPMVDRAVLHTRAVPTTQKPWSKTRDKFWSERHKEAKNKDAFWDQSYL